MARAPRVLVVLLALGLCGLARPASATPCGATFTDDPLLVNTPAKAVHVTELRTAINCVRAEVSLGAASWTQTITAGTTTISAVDVTEMRTALNAAYSAASLTAPSYTDTSLTGIVIKAIHLQELRTAVRILATPDASSATWTLSYYHTDVIGSVRAITDSAGNTVIRHDYAPFGEDSQPLTGDPIRFGGKELDAESGWNYFDARYFRNIYGRFGTVDPVIPPSALTSPQRWNRYAYALNNPFVFIDPSGLDPCPAGHSAFCAMVDEPYPPDVAAPLAAAFGDPDLAEYGRSHCDGGRAMVDEAHGGIDNPYCLSTDDTTNGGGGGDGGTGPDGPGPGPNDPGPDGPKDPGPTDPVNPKRINWALAGACGADAVVNAGIGLIPWAGVFVEMRIGENMVAGGGWIKTGGMFDMTESVAKGAQAGTLQTYVDRGGDVALARFTRRAENASHLATRAAELRGVLRTAKIFGALSWGAAIADAGIGFAQCYSR